MNAPSRTKTIRAAIVDPRLREYTHNRHPECELWATYDPEGRIVVAFPTEREARDVAISFNESLGRHGRFE